MKSVELFIFGDKDHSLLLDSIKTCEKCKGNSKVPEQHTIYCSNNHPVVKYEKFPETYSEFG